MGALGRRLLAAAVLWAVCGAATAFGQTATYSDSWMVDNSGVSYDPAEDADVYPETMGQSLVAGCGVTETDYESESLSVRTTLTSPDGRSASDTSYADPYARVEVTLPPIMSEETGTVFRYEVETRHTYRVESTNTYPEEPMFQPASFGGRRARTPAARLPYWRYYYFFSFALIEVDVVTATYASTGRETLLPNQLKVCWMQKTCASTCGRRSLGYVTVWWETCPSTVGQFSFYYTTPFGSWCVATYGYTNRILPCS